MEKNIREDQEALRDLLARGFRSTPVVLIDGEAVVGFDPDRIDTVLGI